MVHISTYENTASLLIGHPFMSFQNLQAVLPDLTYRKLNNWDAEQLFTCYREEDGASWRRFGCHDTVILKVISELRKFGVGMAAIKSIVDSIKPGLDGHIWDGFSKGDIFLIIKEDLKGVLLEQSRMMADCLSDNSLRAPLLVLPFSVYVREILHVVVGFTDATGVELSDKIRNIAEKIALKEKQILEFIRQDNYHTVTIRKKDGGFIVSTKKTKKGSVTKDSILKTLSTGGYRNVTVITQDGRNIALIDEQTFKI